LTSSNIAKKFRRSFYLVEKTSVIPPLEKKKRFGLAGKKWFPSQIHRFQPLAGMLLLQDGSFADPCTCRRFFQCVEHFPYQNFCPTGLYWDDIK
jgi:hypothetical protein